MCSRSRLSLRCSLWGWLSLELVCSRFLEATAFRFDSELEESVGRDVLGFESEVPFGE